MSVQTSDIAVGGESRKDPGTGFWSRMRGEYLFQGIISLVICVMILAPVVTILGKSLFYGDYGQPERLSLYNFVRAFTTDVILDAIANTIVVSIGSTIFATVFGVTLAWLVVRTDMPGKKVMRVFNTIPFYLSPFVGAIAWTYLCAPRSGYLNHLAFEYLGMSNRVFDIYTLWGIVWVQGIFFTPIVYLMTSAALEQMDPALEESSRSCGRGIPATMLKVTLPLATPSILSAVILTFVSSAGEFGVPLTLGTPRHNETLSTMIYEVVNRDTPEYNLAAAMGSILAVVTIACVFLHRWMVLRRSFTTVTGRGYRPAVLKLGGWKWVGLAFNIIFFLIAVFLPLGILILQSLQDVWLGTFEPATANLHNYPAVIQFIPEAAAGIKNSLILALIGASIGCFLALFVAQTIYRSTIPGRKFVDFVTSLPVGIPGVVFSMGVLLIALRTPFYGMLFVLLIAYLARYMPLGQRSVAGVLLSISRELEEASRACGAGYARTLRRVTVPLVKPGLSAAWLLLFVLFLRELPISILISQSGSEVMSVALLRLLEHATSGETAAYAVIQSVMILGVVLLFQLVTRRSKPEGTVT